MHWLPLPPVMVREYVVECAGCGLVPVPTMSYVPLTAAVVVKTVSVDVPPAVTEVG
ncbi:hypothetical protein [Streptomyces sp. NRRL B-1347]|uniref:hypothetical protein n=1 Tax=Streptomyces sp. NRRL B-1347 TaxID=1476877 RepID=UPI003B63E1DA